jgi:RimJ/RimL family protein N-acetyltransferase
MRAASGASVFHPFVHGVVEEVHVIHPDNSGSRRVAEKCGFQHEGTARGAWYNQGRHHDVEIYSILHSEVIQDSQ